MRLSQLLTTCEPGSENGADLFAHAGYTHRLANGLFTLLPLGHRVMQRVSAIVRQELARVGAQEVAMPLLQPERLWEQRIDAGETRAAAFGTQLFRLIGQQNDHLVLAPTHEEVATVLGAACVRDARDLPRVLYQIQPRFRDQVCPAEVGLLRSREFMMADAYSFHADRASLDTSYAAIKDAFCAVVTRCGVATEIVQAGTGAMGGEQSEELVAPLPDTADMVAVRCGGCGYAASVEIAEFARVRVQEEAPLPLAEVAAPDALSTEEVSNLLGMSSTKHLTWMPFVAGGRILLAVIPGDQFLNLRKLVNALSRAGIDTADFHRASLSELIRRGANYDWISLVRTPLSVLVIADYAVRTNTNFFVPSTRAGNFLVNVNSGRDFRVDLFVDLSFARDGSGCLRCGTEMRAIRGVEVAHFFKLGSRYAEAFGARITCSGADSRPLEMGCYGLGITRLMAVIVEQGRDARGIIWPDRVAPYPAIIVPLQADKCTRSGAERLHRDLSASGLEVLLDDSDAAPEEKLRHADLLGIPLKIILSGDSNDGDIVEIRDRTSFQTHRIPATEINALLRSRAECRF